MLLVQVSSSLNLRCLISFQEAVLRPVNFILLSSPTEAGKFAKYAHFSCPIKRDHEFSLHPSMIFVARQKEKHI